jgi:hypothetical protein
MASKPGKSLVNSLFVTSARNYCNETSLHGFRYLVSERSWPRRLFWTLVTVSMKAVSLALGVYGYMEFINSSTMININSTTASLADLYFPSVFVCNINQVTVTVLNQMELLSAYHLDKAKIDALYWGYVHADSKYWTNKTLLEEMRIKLNQSNIEYFMSKVNWNKNTSFLRMGSQNSSDALISVKWQQKPIKTFFEAYKSNTDYGACSLIYPNLDFDNPETKDMSDRQYAPKYLVDIDYGVRNGIENGLSILVDSESFDYAYYFATSKGFMIAIADTRYTPFPLLRRL